MWPPEKTGRTCVVESLSPPSFQSSLLIDAQLLLASNCLSSGGLDPFRSFNGRSAPCNTIPFSSMPSRGSSLPRWMKLPRKRTERVGIRSAKSWSGLARDHSLTPSSGTSRCSHPKHNPSSVPSLIRGACICLHLTSYLRARYGFTWSDLRDIEAPLRVGDVVILPLTGFSPGTGIPGSKDIWDPESMVMHLFAGSWKEKAFDDTSSDHEASVWIES